MFQQRLAARSRSPCDRMSRDLSGGNTARHEYENHRSTPTSAHIPPDSVTYLPASISHCNWHSHIISDPWKLRLYNFTRHLVTQDINPICIAYFYLSPSKPYVTWLTHSLHPLFLFRKHLNKRHNAPADQAIQNTCDNQKPNKMSKSILLSIDLRSWCPLPRQFNRQKR